VSRMGKKKYEGERSNDIVPAGQNPLRGTRLERTGWVTKGAKQSWREVRPQRNEKPIPRKKKGARKSEGMENSYWWDKKKEGRARG